MFKRNSKRLTGLVLCAALGLSAAFAVPAVSDQLTLRQARALAHLALSKGDADLALKLGNTLVKANPDDAGAHAIVAAAQAQRGKHGPSRVAAARAYRVSDTPKERLKAAQFAARAAMHDGRPTLTQIWLRRAATNTVNEADIKRIGADYARVRAMNPFSFRIGGGVSPSDNVNNGSDSALQIIDGDPNVGYLSGSAQALSGLVATTDVSLRYRLSQTKGGVTSIGTRLYVKRVALSSAAKAMAPGLRNGDLGSTYWDVSIDRQFRWGAKGNTGSVGLALGRTWSGGDAAYDFAKLRGGRGIKLGDATRLSFNASIETRKSAIRASQDQLIASLGLGISHKLSGGDTVSLSYSLSDVDAGHINQRSTSSSIRGSYSFGKPIGPAHITASVTLGQSEYPDFRVGFISVPGGRQDTSAYADLTFFLADYDYAGFAPSIRVRAGKRKSNVSRYEGSEFSVAFEIKSRF